MRLFCLFVMLGGLASGQPAQLGIASWYGEELRGRPMANTKPFDPDKLTCAHWDHPLGTKLKVTNIKNGKSVIVRVTDRGPAKRLNRIIDLSAAAFKHLAKPEVGLIRVKVEKHFTSPKSNR